MNTVLMSSLMQLYSRNAGISTEKYLKTCGKTMYFPHLQSYCAPLSGFNQSQKIINSLEE